VRQFFAPFFFLKEGSSFFNSRTLASSVMTELVMLPPLGFSYCLFF
jgi:hypothetical protein